MTEPLIWTPNVPQPLTPDYTLTTDDLITMERSARRFQGAFTGTSGTLAGFVILLLREVRRLRVETARQRVEAARRENT